MPHFFTRPERVYFVIALLSGLLLCFATPPFRVPDEANHFFRAYEISEGSLLSTKRDGVAGGELPSSIVSLPRRVTGPVPRNPSYKRPSIVEEFSKPLEREQREFVSYSNKALYSPVAY